jgi:hypothetical protein
MQFGRYRLPVACGTRSLPRTNFGDPWDYRMPRINERILECVFYIYPTREAAENGERAGGTGFFTHIVSEADPDEKYVYAVTAKHVIDDIKVDNPIIRVNKRDGWPEENRFIKTDRADWKRLLNAEDDITVYYIGVRATDSMFSIGVDEYLTVQQQIDLNIGPGDDVFMVGRFINRDGGQENMPSLRFGNISMMALRGREDPQILSVEMRSMGGYSGSPVIVYIPPFSLRDEDKPISPKTYFYLLGVDSGHVRDKTFVLDRIDQKLDNELHVYTNTAMENVVPAWRLRKLLNIPQFDCARQEMEPELQ